MFEILVHLAITMYNHNNVLVGNMLELTMVVINWFMYHISNICVVCILLYVGKFW